jgi:hypothetical protein
MEPTIWIKMAKGLAIAGVLAARNRTALEKR